MQSVVLAFFTDLELLEARRELGDLAAVPPQRVSEYVTTQPRHAGQKCFIRPFFLLTFASVVGLVI